MIYPQGIAEAVVKNSNRLQGYRLIDIVEGGHGTKIALFKREHIVGMGNHFAATDILAICTRGYVSEMSV